MILKLFLELSIMFCKGIFNIASSLFPQLNISYSTLISSILSICGMARNFLFFIFGDWLIVILPIVFAQLLLILVVFPIVTFIRGFVRFGGS